MNQAELVKELQFKATRSSGKGGQHVNKVSTKVELYFNIKTSKALSEEKKEILISKLQNRLNKEGILMLHNSETRSQFQNKRSIIKRFFELLNEALIEEKERIATKVPKGVKAKRLKTKRIQSQKKLYRKKPDID